MRSLGVAQQPIFLEDVAEELAFLPRRIKEGDSLLKYRFPTLILLQLQVIDRYPAGARLRAM